jgi:hypothetical protein
MITFLTTENRPEFCADVHAHDTIWVPILSDPVEHYRRNRFSFIYVYSVQTRREYLLGGHHGDLTPVEMPSLTGPGRRFVYRLKTFPLPGGMDADLIHWFCKNEPIPVDDLDRRVLSVYAGWYRNTPNWHDVVPILCFAETCRQIKNRLLAVLPLFEPDAAFEHYNKVLLPNLNWIEQTGVHVDVGRFSERFYPVTDDLVYTEYNPYTTTGRPSNHFRGVNFAALNKSDGSRACITPRDPAGLLLEFDYQSFHLRLIGAMVQYDFPESDIHAFLGRQYLQKDSLTPEEYEQSKQMTFTLLYGDVRQEYLHLPFFRKVHDLSFRYFQDMMNETYVRTPLFHRKIRHHTLESVSRSKIFNYLVQAAETEFNSVILGRLRDYLYGKSSKLVLYTYDSFLIDYSPSDGRQFLNDVRTILTAPGMEVRLKAGRNYHDMVRVEEGPPGT